jgi:probable HAF family extracellular repeat protein
MWHDGVMRDLGTLGGPDAFATWINEGGQIVGYSYVNSTPDPVIGIPPIHPFLWDRGRMIDLGTFGGVFALALNLNNRGQVVGFMDLAGDQTSHPFLWDRGRLIDLGTLGGDSGQANWVNERGGAVGWAQVAGNQTVHAFLWKDGNMHDLGVPAGLTCSVAIANNSREQIVGDACGADGSGHAFLWQNGGPPVELTSLIPASANIHVREAIYVNEAGEIAGAADLPNGDSHAVLLIPCDDSRSIHGCEG